LSLPVAVVQPFLGILLMAAVRYPPLLPSCLIARNAAVALSAVAMRTEKERRKALPEQVNLLPENRFPMRPHASPQGGAGQRQPLRDTLGPACCGDLTKVALPGPRRSERRGSNPSPPSGRITTPLMVGRMIAPAALMMSWASKFVQKTTVSDNR
jgi:hypothetical protein